MPEEGEFNMGRMENDQEGGGNKDRDVQKVDTLTLEYSLPEPTNSMALDALSSKGDRIVVERGAPLLEEELVVREEKRALAGPSYLTSLPPEEKEKWSPVLRGGSGGRRDGN